MTTTTIAPTSRPSGRWLPALSLLVAGAAAALGVVAIATDDVSDQPAQVVVEPAGGRAAAAPVDCRGQARLEIPCFE